MAKMHEARTRIEAARKPEGDCWGRIEFEVKELRGWFEGGSERAKCCMAISFSRGEVQP
jgi:hypothetical protein